jgi:hypothetical protein
MTKAVGQASSCPGGDSNQRRHQHRSKVIPLHDPIRFTCRYVLNFVVFSSPHLMIVQHISYGVQCFQNSGMKISCNFQTAVVAVVRSLLLNSYEYRSQMARVLQFSTLCIARGLHTNTLLLSTNCLYRNHDFVQEKRLSTLM